MTVVGMWARCFFDRLSTHAPSIVNTARAGSPRIHLADWIAQNTTRPESRSRVRDSINLENLSRLMFLARVHAMHVQHLVGVHSARPVLREGCNLRSFSWGAHTHACPSFIVLVVHLLRSYCIVALGRCQCDLLPGSTGKSAPHAQCTKQSSVCMSWYMRAWCCAVFSIALRACYDRDLHPKSNDILSTLGPQSSS